MRIAVDGRHLASGRGVARYSRSLLAALADQFPGDEVRVVEGGRATFASAAIAGRPRLDRMAGGADVVWAPAPAPLAVSANVPLVLTVHDLSWVERPGDFTAYERMWHRLARIPALALRADRVVTDTRVTANSITDEWGVAPERVVVVPPGPGIAKGVPNVRTAIEAKRREPPYFLAVGALEPRKAPDVLARAFARAREEGLEAELVFAGAGRVDVRGEGVEVVTPSDDELPALYAGAMAVVQPSWLEGFAFPPIEGLAYGTPAIVADLPLYDETIGQGALRFAPGDERALAHALQRIANGPELREQLVRLGREAIAPLSWERAARELHDVFDEVAR